MANKFKGEVEFEAGDEKHRLSFSFNALAELEEALGTSVNEVFEKMRGSQLSMTETRKVFWAGLLDHRPDATMNDAKSILSLMSLSEVGDLIGKALTRSVGQGEADTRPSGEGGKSDPLAGAPPGTG